MNPYDHLPVIWFLLLGLLFIGYAILDGFDLGVGALLLRTKTDVDRRILLNAIGPVWDGNEVWLVVGGGALFAAFPNVYATIFSGFYLPFILLLVGLIFRAVAIEFRSKKDSKVWRQSWDVSFCLASTVIGFLAGVALGNIALGVPIGKDGEYTGGFLNLLNPYAVISGLTAVALFMMHGSIYLVMKTEGEVQAQARAWVKSSMIFFGLMYAILTMATFLFAPHMATKIQQTPILFAFPLMTLFFIANIPREISRGKEMNAFVSSCLSIASLLALFGLGLYPDVVLSRPNPENSLTIYNSSATHIALTNMFTIVLIGLPFVLSYTITIYWVFRGKVRVESLHY
jgi:cytochrome d ubiquinol oxidase subunit II